MSTSEKTLVLVKPDGVARGLVGEIIARIERKGYTIAQLRMLQADRALLEQHYAEHQGKPFFEPLVEFMLSGPIVALVVEGNRVIEGFRNIAGTTDPTVADPGTIRGDLARDAGTKVTQNLVIRLLPIPARSAAISRAMLEQRSHRISYTALTHLSLQLVKSQSSLEVSNV
ncbi:MAG: hypothetical protein RLZZ364_987 [Actinomycetota bacterium]